MGPWVDSVMVKRRGQVTIELRIQTKMKKELERKVELERAMTNHHSQQGHGLTWPCRRFGSESC